MQNGGEAVKPHIKQIMVKSEKLIDEDLHWHDVKVPVYLDTKTSVFYMEVPNYIGRLFEHDPSYSEQNAVYVKTIKGKETRYPEGGGTPTTHEWEAHKLTSKDIAALTKSFKCLMRDYRTKQAKVKRRKVLIITFSANAFKFEHDYDLNLTRVERSNTAGLSTFARQDMAFTGTPAVHLGLVVAYKCGDELFSMDMEDLYEYRDALVVDFTEERYAFLKRGYDTIQNMAESLDKFIENLRKSPKMLDAMIKQIGAPERLLLPEGTGVKEPEGPE